jgi:hypothetical protein
MIMIWTWTHGHFPFHQFQADALRVFAKLKKLLGGHFNGAYGH